MAASSTPHDSGHGGWGACATHDGSGPYRTMAHGDTRIIPLELQESLMPFRIEQFSLREDSGGAGKFRGGMGFRKVYRLPAAMPAWHQSRPHQVSALGRAGRPGRQGRPVTRS
jgi:N-methylhydantoinase B/oxoprolinase/acetone carboxylase alpha subunit